MANTRNSGIFRKRLVTPMFKEYLIYALKGNEGIEHGWVYSEIKQHIQLFIASVSYNRWM